MTTVIHTGDTHLGYRQYHSPVRRRDFLDAFRRVVEDAIADDVDAVVHAGDLYHDRTPGLEDLMGTIEVLRPLADADIPFLAVVGNHEGTRHAQWLDLFETLGLAERLDSEGRVVGDTALYGLDYVPESKRDALDYQFAERDTAHAALVSHGLFQPFPHGTWDLAEILDAANVAFDAVLLGDDHTPDTRRIDGTWATYCGSTERASASERDPRGYNVVEFAADDERSEASSNERTGSGESREPGDGVTIRRRGIDTRDFVFVDLELADGEGEERVRQRIREESVEDAVVVVTVEGDGGDVTPADVERFGDERGALVTRVNDRREVDVEVDVDASFADPDEAVQDRVRELGLSEAARGIDETVRTDDVAKSNVRDTVEDRVRELVEDDLTAFEGADEDASGEGEAATSDDGGSAAAGADGGTATDPADAARADVDGAGDESGKDDGDDAGPSTATTMEDYL